MATKTTATPQTIDDLAAPPMGVMAANTSGAVHLKPGFCGEQVRIVLAAGEGAAGKEAQFIRVNEETWLVPRNIPVVVPVEAYEALANTLPPGADDVRDGIYTPRFSVSVMERIPAPQRQAA